MLQLQANFLTLCSRLNNLEHYCAVFITVVAVEVMKVS